MVLLVSGSVVQAQHSRTLTRTVDLDAEGKVELVTTTGQIQVVGEDRSTAALELTVEGDDPDAVENLGIDVRESSNQLTVQTEGADPGGPGFWELIGFGGGTDGPSTSITLRMPAEASLSAVTENAQVDVEGMKGETTIEANASSIRLRRMDGRTIVGTLSGTVNVEDIRGELIAGTFSGELYLRLARTPPKVQVGSFSGNAEITLPTDAAFDLSTDVSWGGEIVSDFELPEDADGPISVGGGGAQITFESFTGDLLLRAE